MAARRKATKRKAAPKRKTTKRKTTRKAAPKRKAAAKKKSGGSTKPHKIVRRRIAHKGKRKHSAKSHSYHGEGSFCRTHRNHRTCQ